MRKLLLTLTFLASFASVASADWLLNTNYYCIKSFYFKPSVGQLVYTRSDTGATSTTTTKNLGDDLIAGYEYNATSQTCQKIPVNNTLGLDNYDYSAYMAITGLLTGSLLVVGLFLGLKVA